MEFLSYLVDPGLDPIAISVVRNNFFTGAFVFALLKGCAKLSKSTTDDKIMTMLGNAFGVFKKFRPTDDKK